MISTTARTRVGRRSAALLILVTLAACGPKTPVTRPAAPPAAPAVTPPVAPATRQQIAVDLDRIFDAPAFDRMQWAAVVQSLDSGAVLYQRNASKLLMPASNMKIVTLAAAAERLGWDHRFRTRLVTTGTIDGGVLHGDLVAIGSGDPTINGRHGGAAAVFAAWADRLKAAGIERIDGRIVADPRAFPAEGLGAGWAWDYLGDSYAAPVSALQVNEDVAEVLVRPGRAAGDPAGVEVRPAECGLLVDNRLTTSASGEADVELHRLPGSNRLLVTGTVPIGAPETTRKATVDDPAGYFVRVLRASLIDRGIAVSGEAVSIEAVGNPDLTGGRLLLEHQSPPLSVIATVLMKVSQNLYAETLLRALGTAEGGSARAGQKVVREVLTGWGIAPDAYVLADGSGLSRYNYVCADTLVRILGVIHRDPRHRDAFQATLPVGGQDGGTIARRFKGTRAEGNVRAKTGSISNVRALSGYVTTLDGEPLVFSIIANGFTQPQETIDAATDLAVERLANVRR